MPSDRRASQLSAECKKLQQAIGNQYEVLAPGDADDPILAPNVRRAVFEWLLEYRAIDELKAVGIKPRSSALLVGPPGTGKTTLAHHLSARLGIPMVVVGSEGIFDSYLGESEKNVARLFNGIASVEVPCLLFLDEIDAIGSKRGDGSGKGGAQAARNSTLNVLLRKVEQFSGMMIGATNMADSLDPALWRRFGMQLVVDLPGRPERFAIIKRYGLPFEFNDDDIEILTDLTDGASPALLRGLMEGVKRWSVLAPKTDRADWSAAKVIGDIVQTISPPPGIVPPPLWAGCKDGLSHISWPPLMPDVDGKKAA